MNREHIHLPRDMGDRVADIVANGMGSWRYIIIQSIVVVFWIALNAMAWFVWKWDTPPFILLNLIFSTQASYSAPIIMMSQNRQAAKDRKRDDLEAQEIDAMFTNNALLIKINQQQLEILQMLEVKGEEEAMAFKQDSLKVKKIEETTGKDVDHDGDLSGKNGESPAHNAKVRAAAAKNKGKMAPPFAKGGKASGGKMCPACKKAGKTSCSHM